MMSMNSNKRKGRANTNSKLGRSKSSNEKSMAFDGVYGNSRLMHATASLVGCVVQVQVRSGEIYEGILCTFSHQLDLVLEVTHKVSLKSSPTKGAGPAVSNLLASYPFEDGIAEKLIFRLKDVVMLKATNVDSEYAVRENFTDTAISKYNGQIIERELEPWEGPSSDSEIILMADEDEGANGWDANDMFRTNAEKYGVKSSYDNSLQEYTVPLTKKDTEEYKIQEARALKIAQEIETNTSYQKSLQLENGDEEDRYSAVHRPIEDPSTQKYVAPQKRRAPMGPKRQLSTTCPSPVPMPGPRPYLPIQTAGVAMVSTQGCKPYPGHILVGSLEKPRSPPTPPAFQSLGVARLSPTAVASLSLPLAVPKDTVDKSVNGEPPMEKDEAKAGHVSAVLENVPLLPLPPKTHIMGPPNTQTVPPRIERRRENERKHQLQKPKGRDDEIEEFKKFSTTFKLTEENKESKEPRDNFQSNESKIDQSILANKMAEKLKLEKEAEEKSASLVKSSTLNPNAKEFVFNPNAKSFTPRSMAVTSPQAPHPMQPQRMQAQSPVMAVQHSQMIPGLPQPIFTTMTPQYVMQAAPVSMALTSPFAAASLSQAPRFRKVPITMQPRHDISPSMHVAAATGQPILAPAAIPTPSQLTMQYTPPPGVIHAPGPPQQTMGYPQMNFVVGPRVMSPQPVGVVPTSHSVSYCDTSHLPAHLLNKYCIAVSAPHPGTAAPHSLQQQQSLGGQHSNHPAAPPPQSQAQAVHPSPSPVHQGGGNHSQPPTPTAVMFPGGPMGHPLAGHHGQSLGHHPMHHPGFPGGPQPVVLMQQQPQPLPGSHHGGQQGGGGGVGGSGHHPIHVHSLHGQNPPAHLLPQMALIPTSAATPPFVQHPQGMDNHNALLQFYAFKTSRS